MGFLLTVVSFFVAPVVMLFAVWLIEWDVVESPGNYAEDVTFTNNSTIRGDLPKWLRWFQTPDERFPGGLYEPAVYDMLLRRGKTITSWYWAGWRNQLIGMAAYFGKPTTDYIPDGNGFWQRGDVWRLSIPIGFGRVLMGWKAYRNPDKTFLAVPMFTLKHNLP
jgi:hypothetical protein